MSKYQITEWCHQFIRNHVQEGDICIDATAGNGNDTKVLCELVGADGKVIAFDIQESAIAHTAQRLTEHGLLERAELVIVSSYYNRPNHPPIPVLIIKL